MKMNEEEKNEFENMSSSEAYLYCKDVEDLK
jgi:hypothetical protein